LCVVAIVINVSQKLLTGRLCLLKAANTLSVYVITAVLVSPYLQARTVMNCFTLGADLNCYKVDSSSTVFIASVKTSMFLSSSMWKIMFNKDE
jgi:hypothetical protein